MLVGSTPITVIMKGENMGDVYSITNIFNRKIYIGATTKDYRKRWKQHLFDAQKSVNKNRDLYKDIIKYGQNAFRLDLLYSIELEEDLYAKEKQIILKLREEGYELYNISLGGKGRSTLILNKQEIISYYLFLSDFNVQETGRFFKIDAATVKKILKEYHIQPLTVKEQHKQHGLKVAQCDINTHEIIKIFHTLSEAAESIGRTKATSSAIRHCLKGRNKSAYGFYWKEIN